ncbi:hypothetical protein BK749_08060 [Bacillus thuringiensis serovar vazensis]|uniref:Uncharacterized protein n=2 Tax=Bacillus thuringiensis TaxID=1428 RepID=A0A243CYU5_BACTU|nr:hypothetical protein BK699_05560 [Bacillus thuringiensis serovar mexicanensis]OTX10782.1 hypothetical protein BK705_01550 [Bacillus thuringiensis serovar monterrey]OTY78129.1 hypothetical protein BK749_08060 [Bacillus thuringiensis serovar vazensis]
MRSSLICELIHFIFYCKILLPLYYSNTILKIQPLIYTFITFYHLCLDRTIPFEFEKYHCP